MSSLIGVFVRLLFTIFLAVALLALSWFQFLQPLSFEELRQKAEDQFDERPARQILVLGNSRTFQNHMPQMLRAIADSAGSPQKYQISQQTPPGSSLESLWASSYTQELLRHTWDDAIVQAESRAFSGEDLTKSFMTYGPKLLRAIKVRDDKPGLVANWEYEPTAAQPFSETDRDYWQRAMDRGHQRIAGLSGARLIKLSKIWNAVRRHHPEIAMTTDGNHPTLAASYLYALFLYKQLSDDRLSNVTFVPSGLSVETAAIMNDAVSRYPYLNW